MNIENATPAGSRDDNQPPSKPPLVRVLPSEALAEAAGDKPSIELPGDNRLISEYASEVGAVFHDDSPIFLRNGEVVRFDQDTSRILTVHPQEFRTLAETYCLGFKLRGEDREMVTLSMTADIAQAVLHSADFTSKLCGLRRVNPCRQPIIREDGQIELLPEGYDAPTQTLTLGLVQFPEDVDLEAAKETLKRVFAEFCFVDEARALAVAIAGMLSVFAQGLLPLRSLRPCIIVLANGEGAGKTLLVKLMIFPTLGSVPVGSRPEREEEIEKVLLATVREGKLVLFLDNLKGHLASPRIEAFQSSEIWRGRILGSSRTYEGENLASMFITGNGLTVSPDMRRRSLFIELHLAVERAEDRTFDLELNDETMTRMRPELVGALWALIRHWDSVGRPECSRTNSSFSAWARVIGGIIEAAGLGCCIDPAQVAAAADQDGADMRRLVEAMAGENRPDYSFHSLVEIATEQGCFEHIIGVATPSETDLDFERKLSPSQCSKLGRFLERYNQRQVSAFRFVITGKGHSRRFAVQRLATPPECTAEVEAPRAPEPPRLPSTPPAKPQGESTLPPKLPSKFHRELGPD